MLPSSSEPSVGSAQKEREPLFDGEFDTDAGSAAEMEAHADGGSSAILRSGRIDTKSQRFPFCLVWGPLPLISWLCPWIGHLGIADSEGIVHDFAGPYTIGLGEFMTGSVVKYYQAPRELWASSVEAQQAWDSGVRQADATYGRKFHNIVTCNCHHHTAHALASMRFPNSAAVSGSVAALDLPRMSMLRAWWLITTRGKFVSTMGWISTYGPFLIGLVLVLVFAIKWG